MLKKLIVILFLLLFFREIKAQELDCYIEVNHDQVANVDPNVFKALEEAVFEFINNRKWTKHVFKNDERIECSMVITIQEQVSNNKYKANIQVQSRRPVFNTSYNSPVFNHMDREFTFEYLQYDPLQFSEQSHISNLSSVLAFYAYYVIGLDYDTFSPEGGTPFFQKAQKIVNNAQNAREEGWKAFQSKKNRYWIVQNMLERVYNPLRKCLYQYHRKGLDIMAEKREEGRENILSALKLLEKVHNQKPSSFQLQLFFQAKSTEIIKIFSEATPNEKQEVINLLSEIDPGNINKYQKIRKN